MTMESQDNHAMASAKKRKAKDLPSFVSPTPAKKPSDRTTKLRSSVDGKAPSITKPQWTVGQDVWVKVKGGNWTQGVVRRLDYNVEIKKKFYPWAVSVEVQLEANSWIVPCTWDDRPLEIPSIYANKVLAKFDHEYESLSPSEQKTWRVLKYNTGPAGAGKSPTDSLSSSAAPSSKIDEILMDEKDSNCLKRQIDSLMSSADVAKLVKKVTGAENVSVLHALRTATTRQSTVSLVPFYCLLS